MTSDAAPADFDDHEGAEIDSTEEVPANTPATRLVALQDLDTQIDQLTHRRERLPEREVLAAATEQMKTWDVRRTEMRQRLDELTGVIEKAESETAELESHKDRLQAQLKTVIAPREAEALMHEIDGLDEQRDVVETNEIEALEEQATLDDQLTAHLSSEESLRNAMSSADDVLAAVVSDIDAELEQLTSGRDAARTELSDSMLARYDRIRSSSGVAVARLEGRRCSGCHLDMSAAESDDVHDEATANGGVADCPQCGRMLIV